MLQITDVTKRFGGVVALNDCSFTVEAGKITALVGPNGAGKTTLLDVISGLVKPDRGSINLQLTAENLELTTLRPHQIAAVGITRTWQQVRLFKYLSIQDHLQLAADNEDTKLLRNLVLSSKRISSKQKNLQLRTYNLQLETKNLQVYIEHYGIGRPINTLVSDLSYGQRKLLQLAMAVLQPHKILLLDEPVAGVNKVIQQKVEQMLLHLKGMGETIVVIEHDMEFIKKLADEVVVMDAGKVLVEGRPEVVLQDKRVLAAYLGE